MMPESGHERLWTPWRMRYIAGQAKEEGCIFCNRLHGTDDVSALILHRGTSCFAIMNLFPYNTGHIMIVPNQHADDLNQLDAATMHEMADLLPVATRALRRVLNCQGFNIGLNIGSVAGAGVAEHLHQHIVPRWLGDANFMPILASTTVIPELIPATYAKVRAELVRELSTVNDTTLLILVDNDTRFVLIDGHLPNVTADPETSIWKTSVSSITGWATAIEIAGWAGPDAAEGPNADVRPNALVLRASIENPEHLPKDLTIVPLGEGLATGVSSSERAIIEQGLVHLAPRLAQPEWIDQK